jgi:hypothetical protein
MIAKIISKVILLTVVMNCCFPLISFALQSPQEAEVKLQDSSGLEQPILVTSFANREIIQKGEVVTIKIWLESKLITSATVTLFFADENLLLNGNNSQQVDLPLNAPITFGLTGIRDGKSNILIHILGENKNTDETITTNQQIKGLEVKPLEPVALKILSHPLSGVLIGALLTYLTTALNDYRGQRKEENLRKQWIVANLPAQLEANRQSVIQGQEVEPESWMGKLLTEGYYSEIQRLIKRNLTQVDLARALLEIGFLLKDYEYDRLNNRLIPQKQGDLAEKLSQAIVHLNELV